MSAAPPSPDPQSSAGRPGARSTRPRRLSTALGWTVLGALVPGVALLRAGRRVAGVAVLLAFVALAGVLAWLATGGQRTAAVLAVDSTSLLWLVAGVAVLALAWAIVVVAGYALLRPDGLSRARRALGAAVVAVLVLAVVAPAVLFGRLATVQRDLIAGVFADGESATVEDVPDPFGDKERVNVLLLGGDGGDNREGVRTDTVIVASVDTDTGDTTLISLPRNLQDLPFPPGPLDNIYPQGFDAGSESESLLNAVYRNGPAQNPDVLGRTDHPGGDFLKLGVGEALGLTIDYFVLVNLDGFSRLVDALGGITVNVNYYVPIGGNPSTGQLPEDYIAPGPDQEMDGRRALNFARGRFGLSDYDRMARQRCAIDAIIDAADPVTLLRRYQTLAQTTEDIVETDIPSRALDDFVDLAFLVKDADIRSLVLDDTVIDPAYPDYDEIRDIVDEALDPSPPVVAAPSTGTVTGPAPDGENGDGSGDGVIDGGDVGGEADEPTDSPVDIADACAYDPERAAEARAQGEPPTR